MAKFINSKEQVFDLKLTSYGHYLLSNGTFKPSFYGFYDDNVIYDSNYAGFDERQNETHDRIKNKTSYLESLVLFEEVEKSPNTVIQEAADKVYFSVDVDPIHLEPRKDIFRFENMIGDAYLEGETQNAPAWKLAMLRGQISSSVSTDVKNDVLIPQINIDANYRLKIVSPDPDLLTDRSTNIVDVQTRYYSDNRKIVLEQEDVMIYFEEQNTILLNENFDIEVFEIGVDEVPATHANGKKTDLLKRKTFLKDKLSLKGDEITEDYFISPASRNFHKELQFNNEQSEYFFSILTDQNVNKTVACRGSEIFNKDSYYVDLDFDCNENESEQIYYDIYGPVTEPEICP